MSDHIHEWRSWPCSDDVLCLKCNYQIIGGVHFPCGNPKWMMPAPETVELEHDGIRYVVPKSAEAAFKAALDEMSTQARSV